MSTSRTTHFRRTSTARLLEGIVCLASLVLVPCVVAAERQDQASAGGDPAARTDRQGDPLPEGAVARLGTVRWRQPLRDGSGFARVTLSPDGKLLASTGSGGLRLWETAAGKRSGWSPKCARAVAALFSPDGKTLITEEPATEADRPELAQGKRLIQYWEVGTGKLVGKTVLERAGATEWAPALSPNGKALVHSDQEKKLAVWDAFAGKKLFEFDLDLDPWSPISLSLDGKLLVSAGTDNSLGLHDTATGKQLHRIPWKGVESSGYFFTPVFSPDGKLLAEPTPGSLRVWDTATGKLKQAIEGPQGRVAFSADGKYLACGDHKAIRLWETASLREVRRLEEHGDHVRALAFSADGRLLASAQEHTLALWDVATGKQRNRLPAHQGVVYSVAFTRSGTQVVSGGDDGSALVWDLGTARLVHRLPGHFFAAVSLACSPDNKVLATGDGQPYGGRDSREAQIRLWDLREGRLLRQFTGHLNSVESLTFSPDGRRLVSGGGDARFRMWDAGTGQRLYQVRGSDGRRSVAFSPDGRLLLMGHTQGELALYQADTGKKLRDLGTQGDERRYIVHAAFLRDGKTVVSEDQGGAPDTPGRLQLWDVESGRELRSVPVPGSYPFYGNSPSGHAVSPDGATAATVSNDFYNPVIQLWDTASGKPMAVLRGHTGMVTTLAFAPDGRTLASGSRDTSVLIWDVEQVRLKYLWTELAAGAEPAAQELTADPVRAVGFLKERLAHAARAEVRARRLVADLDADEFRVREAASRELERLGPDVAVVLRLTLEEKPSAEVRSRIQEVFDHWKVQGKAVVLLDAPRVRFALGVLEKIGTPEARKILDELARGPAEATVTREARAVLERFKKPNPEP